MTNYIGKIEAEWVDPAVELPPDGWRGMITWKGNGEHRMGYWSGMEWRSTGPEPFSYYLNEIVAWLRIGGPSDAVPRAQVQAAVDEMVRSIVPLRDGTLTESGQVFEFCADIITDHTGVTPSEVMK